MLSPSCQQRLNLAALVLNGHFYNKIVREAVSFDADVAIVNEADVVVGEGDLVQVEAEQGEQEDEEQIKSPLMNCHPIPQPQQLVQNFL